MKKYTTGLLAFAMVTAIGTQMADARESTQSYTCSALKQLVKQRGSIVMDTKRPGIFRKFVANRSYCTLEEKTKGHSVPAADGKCRLRICVSVDPFHKRRQ